MATKLSAEAMLEREYLQVRSRLLDIAASLDRLERAGGIATDNPTQGARWKQLMAGLAVLVDGRPDRAERVQQVFSDAYESHWRSA